jgi:oligopeptide/dipeptide ABC transporter ATP-binding protein
MPRCRGGLFSCPLTTDSRPQPQDLLYRQQFHDDRSSNRRITKPSPPPPAGRDTFRTSRPASPNLHSSTTGTGLCDRTRHGTVIAKRPLLMQDRRSYLTASCMESLLQVRDLHVDYCSDGASPTRILRGISMSVGKGESIGVLGESGCGKSTLALAILRLLPASARVAGGSICFQGRDLAGVVEREMEHLRGASLSLIFQDSGSALHPIRRVGAQIADVIAAHRPEWSGRRCREVAETTLNEVGLNGEGRFYSSYPHELSGGQRQRVVIAQAVACRPELLVADEPTSSLDSTVQAEILSLLNCLRRKRALSLIFISHNPAVLAEVADRIVVIYGGQVIEEGAAPSVLASPQHPFTRALLRCVPSGRGRNAGSGRLSMIPGSPPDPAETPAGCVFAPRCSERMTICSAGMPAEVQSGACRVRCFKYGG